MSTAPRLRVVTGPWSATVGQRPFLVHVEERVARGSVAYLRWWDVQADNWRAASTGVKLRDVKGRLMPGATAEAIELGQQKAAALQGPATATPLAGSHLTLEEGWLRVSHPETGRWPMSTPHRREAERAMQFVMAVLGRGMPFVAIRKAELRKVWRAKIKELEAAHGAGPVRQGHRGAEIVIARLLTVAAWLRDEELLPAGACVAPRVWKQELLGDWRTLRGETRDPEPHRPRFTMAEAAAIIAKVPEVDPRLALLIELGLELRPGQVARCRRSDLDLEASTLRVHGQGKKKGVTVELTEPQHMAVLHALTDGYLATLEAGQGDFPLFPQGKLAGRSKGAPRASERQRTAAPLLETTLGEWFRVAEKLAGVPHVRGRGLYGFRRLAVDQSDGLDALALQEMGGWTDEQTPNRIYRDKIRKGARGRAREHRAGFREQIKGLTPETVTEPVTSENTANGGEGAK